MDRFFASPEGYSLPADMGLFKFLLMLSSSAHLIAFYMTLGAAIIGLYYFFRKAGNPVSEELYSQVVNRMPVLLTVTLISAVAPVLFEQIAYGRALYPAVQAHGYQLIIAGILVAGLIIFSSVRVYGKKVTDSDGWIILALTVVSGIWFSLLTTNVSVLKLNPDAVTRILLDPSASPYGHGDSQFLPLWILFLVHSVAAGFIYINSLAHFSGNVSSGLKDYLLDNGFKGFTIGAVVAIIVLFWWMFTLSNTAYDSIVDGHIILIYISAIVFAIPIILLANKIHEAGIYIAGLVPAFFVVFIFEWMRMLAVDDKLVPSFINHSETMVQMDYGNLFLFVFLLMVGVTYFIHLISLSSKFKETSK